MSNSTGTNLENRISNENLVRRIQNGKETAANMAQLWQQTKAFIAMIARKYTGYAEFDDLVQEGYLGLYEAVNHYDTARGIPFINYACLVEKVFTMRREENSISYYLKKIHRKL